MNASVGESPSPLLLDPLSAVFAAVVDADPALDGATVRRVLEEVGGGRAKRRRLALALAADPSVLTTGRSPAPRVVGDLLLALRAEGSEAIASPRCGGCGREITSMQLRGEEWLCSPCFLRPQICAACGEERQVGFRDRHGRPRCGGCPDEDPRDPLVALVELVTTIDPGLSGEAVRSAVAATVTKAAHVRKLLWALEERPALLTDEGAMAPFPMVLRLIDALCDAGATVVQRPACGRCRRVVTLSKKADGVRICRNCCARAHAVACSQCGAVREPAARDVDGRPLCPFCLVNDPVNQEECVGCRRRRRVATRDADGPRCEACRPKTVAICSVCGRSATCRTSTVTGHPWCAACAHSWAACSRCGQVARLQAGTRAEPLCAACTDQDLTIWKFCSSCGAPGRVATRRCSRCRLRDRLDTLFAGTDGDVRPELHQLHRAVGELDRPATALRWASSSTVVAVLGEIAREERPLTHAALDELPASKTLAHLRAVLVATGALPVRDEHLAQIEAWIAEIVAARPDLAERQLLGRYAIWHVLRRLRQRTRTTAATAGQAKAARANIQGAVAFLDWLAARQLTLATCSQLHLDEWMATTSIARHGRTGPFVRWARRERLTRLDFPATAWTGPSGVLDTEGRWEQARRLIHDAAVPTDQRVAGLLVLLYAQRAATISRLSIDNIEESHGEMGIRLGREPVILPEPVADLVRELVDVRVGHATIGSDVESPWLFPGGRPGQPISSFQLTERLKQIGIYAGKARTTALFQLANEVPAAILARVLGIHISVAVKWQRVAAGDWGAYAADVSRRGDHRSTAPSSESRAEG